MTEERPETDSDSPLTPATRRGAGVSRRAQPAVDSRITTEKWLMNSSWSGLMVDSQGMRNSQPKRPRPIPPMSGRLGGPKSGPSPVDRARPGSKHQVLTDGQGIPLAVSLTGENRTDITQLLPLPTRSQL